MSKDEISIPSILKIERGVTAHIGDFLKEALLQVPADKPFRGPCEYRDGDYTYKSTVKGDFEWFQGYEVIAYRGEVIYECHYHGTLIK